MKVNHSTASTYDFMMFLFYSFGTLGILVLVGPRFNRLVALLLEIPYSLYLVSQTVYYSAFSQYYRFSTALSLSKEIAGVSDSVFELVHFKHILPFIILITIVIVFTILYYLFQKDMNYSKKMRLSSIILIVISLSCLLINKHNIKKSADAWTDFDIYKSDYYIYEVMPNTNQFVERFGLLNMLGRDVKSLINPKQVNEEDRVMIDNFFNDKKRNTDNEMTGIFKDKSVLVIQAESLINLGISEEFTPNLYYYMQNGIVIKDFNSPLLVGSTSDSEFMANTSIIPMTSGYPVCYEYINNTYPLTLGNIFKNNGYDTLAFHNNYAEYYNRDTAFAKYGYNFFDSSKMGLENLEPDLKFGEQIGWILQEKPRFLGYWITYSGHQPYDLNATGVSEEDVKIIKSKYPNLDDQYVAYIAKQMDLDKAIFNFLNVMDWQGRLDDVVIIVFGDHIAKGIDFSKGSNFDEVFHLNSQDNPEIIKTPMFIYANNLTNKGEYHKVSTGLDILPTMANLFKIECDLKYALGNDIFDPEYKGFYFDESGILSNDYFSYNTISEELKLSSNYLNDDAQKDIAYYNKIKDVCAKILQLDYFAQE